ncbi:MAG: DMT family transporter [Anaerolineae bacterium]|nr:DMT family transporter [Anaerolineae bacterium]
MTFFLPMRHGRQRLHRMVRAIRLSSVSKQALRSSRFRHYQGIVAVLLAGICLGASSILAKFAYRAGADPLTMLALRFGLAAILIWPGYLTLGKRYIRATSATVVGCLLVGSANIASADLFFTGLTRLDAALASLVFYTYPLSVILLLLALGEHQTIKTIVRLGLTLAGLVLLTGRHGQLAPDRAGVLMVLGGGVAYALHLVLSQVVLRARGVQSPTIVLYVLTTIGVGMVLCRILAGGPLPAIAVEGWLAIIGLAVVSTILARLFLFAGIRRIGSAQASLIGTAEPVFAVILAYVVLAERLAWMQLAGGVLVLASVVLSALEGRNREGERQAIG